MNYFELFEVPPGPSVDRAVISRNYIELQKKYHPDFNTGSDDDEQEDILLKSAEINKGYKIFLDPWRTIEYYLQFSGLIEPGEKFELPKEFLMEMMEINELLQEDQTSAENDIEAFSTKLDSETKNIIENYWAGNVDGESLNRLKLNFYKKKYLQRILERIGD